MAQRRIWWGPAILLAGQFGPAWAQTTDQQPVDRKIEQLETRVEELECEVKPDKAPNAAAVTADTSGFTIRSNNGDFLLKIGADLQIDNRTYVGEGSASDTDTIVGRRIRPTFSGTAYKYVDYFFRPDFGQGTTAIYDAYIQLNYLPWANLRVGKFKPPVGLERLQSDDDTNFIERGMPTLLVPQRDIGYQLSANLWKRRVYYALGVFNGVPDSSIGTDTAVSNHRDYAARVFLTPFRGGGESPLSGLGLGVAATGGSTGGEALPSYKTVGQQTFFSFVQGVTAAGHRTRLAPQGYYYRGPFGVLADYGVNQEGFQKGGIRREIAFRAWQVQTTYILTGEAKSYDGPTPRHSFDPLHGGWGAVELAVRVGDFAAGNGVYSYGLVDPNTTPRRAREWVGGVNWYLNRLVRISGDYGQTAFSGGAANGNKLPEKVILMRFQINFI